MSSNNVVANEEGRGTALQLQPLEQLLSHLDIEPCYHSLILLTCAHKEDYLKDIEAEDLQGEHDANGDAIPAAVARGLVRKLRSSAVTAYYGSSNTTVTTSSVEDGASTSDDPAKNPTASSPIVRLADSQNEDTMPAPRPLHVSLRRGAGGYNKILRCAVRGQFLAADADDDGGSTGASSRRGSKILCAILDNSYSMSVQWPLVVDAIGRVFTDRLLQDEDVKLLLVVYNTDAREVTLPRTAAELTSVLKIEHSPTGLTNFEDAFRTARGCIRRAADSLRADRGVPVRAVDVTALLFTDGQDTSVPPLGYVSKAATDKARRAGDEFQAFLSSLDCRAHYTCIAAFGEHHNPGQCQYLSDRYYYINRPEVLSDWLSGGLADLLEVSSFCSIEAELPAGVSLAEPLPKSIGLEGDGNVAYEIWLYAEAKTSSSADKVFVAADASEMRTLRGSAALCSATAVDHDSLEGRIFLLDFAEMQLRQIARELIGRRPSQTELSLLRERLAGVKVLSQPVWDVANDPKSRLFGRAVLLARLEELETRRKRLSYALGHFEEEESGDTRKMGAVGIDAVLRDASQRVALGAATMKHVRRAETSSALPLAEDLSEYGKKFTFDKFSECNAKEAADHGDALFYRASDIVWKDGKIQSATGQGGCPIAFSIFELLSNNGKKVVEDHELGSSISHVGIPVFGSPGHFARANVVMRDVLERLDPAGEYTKGTSELLFIDLLSHHLVSLLQESNTLTPSSSVARSHGLLHRVRSVAALLGSMHVASFNTTLLEIAMEEAQSFLDNPEKRPIVKNLYRIFVLGLLAAEFWPPQQFMDLGRAVLDESMRRSISRSLSGLSDSDRIKLAFALLGPPNEDGWLGCPIQAHSSVQISLQNFCFQGAASDLKMLEEQSPGEYSPRDSTLMSQILGSTPPSGTPPLGEWNALRSLAMRWGAVLEQAQVISSGGLWGVLDDLMMNESALHSTIMKLLGEVLAPGHAGNTLRESLTDEPTQALSDVVLGCISALPSYSFSDDDDDVNLHSQPLRLVLASKISSYVKQQAQYARIHPILGAAYPTSQMVSSRDMQLWWGSAARPINEPLYREVRRSIHRKHPKATLVVKEALTDKAYSLQGGHFEFPSEFDTFIPGLHRRTRDLHDAWGRKGKRTQGAKARAVKEMLLRLRWDRRDDRARAKLSKIVAQIWDGLDGIAPCRPIPSALWIEDEEERGDTPAVPDFVSTCASNESTARDNESVNTNGEAWSVL